MEPFQRSLAIPKAAIDPIGNALRGELGFKRTGDIRGTIEDRDVSIVHGELSARDLDDFVDDPTRFFVRVVKALGGDFAAFAFRGE